MQVHNTITFKTELQASPKPVFAIVLLFGCLLFIAIEILPVPWEFTNTALSVYLFMFFYSIIGWVLDDWNSLVGRWFAFIGLTCLIFLFSNWLKIPEILVFEIFPIALLANTISLTSALVSTILEILILFGLLRLPMLNLHSSTVIITSIALSLMLGMIYAIYQPLNKLTEWLSTYFDQTQRFLKDARERKVELEQVSESVANANRQLVLANKKMAMLSKIAEDAQKAKTVFVANVSHEFRTPLNMIIGLIDLMMRTPDIYDVVLSPKMRDDLSVIFRNCEHLSNMINDVLDLTRIETGRLALYREWVDLEETIRKGVSVVRPLLETKHLSIDLVFSTNLPKVYCDRIRIQQVVLNLLSNAARFTETGGITVKVDQEASKVLVEVTDTGPGIAPDDAEKIFEPFWQGKEPVWHAKGGSGLGLSLSREFVQLHGGKMWFNSSPGKGTSFYFNIPFAPLEDPASGAIRNLEDWVWMEDSFKSSKVSSQDSVVKPRTLIFDKSEILYPRFQRYSDQIDFVNLTDLNHLPKMNLAQAVVINAENYADLQAMLDTLVADLPETPIIGCKVGRETQRAIDLGAKGYLIKPVVYEMLKKSLEALGKPICQVLIVDDDREVQQLFGRMVSLYDATINVQMASSGEEALEIIQKKPPDLMLLDLVMPGMNGWQVLENVNRLSLQKTMDTLFITAQDPAEQTVSDYLITTIKGGIPMDKVFRLSVEIPRLLMEPGRGLDPTPG